MKRFKNYNHASQVAHTKQKHDMEWKYQVKSENGSFIIQVSDLEGRIIGII